MDEDFLAQLMASQDTPKKRKRGGLAGIYDRNKQIIKPVVSGALGLVPGIGMGLAAGAGALMSGLDREGKGGIGFDAKQGVSGALQGAAAGKVAQMGRAGLTKVLGRGAQEAAQQTAGQVGANMTPLGVEPGQTINTATGQITGSPFPASMQRTTMPPMAPPSAPVNAATSMSRNAAFETGAMPFPAAETATSMSRNAAFETGAGAAAPAGSGMQFGATPAPDFSSRIAGIGDSLGQGSASAVPPAQFSAPSGGPSNFLTDEALRNVGNSNYGNTSRGGGRGLMRGLSRVGQFVDKNATATGMGLQALSSILGSQSERRLREREQAEERRRAENVAMYALPIYRNNMRNMQGGR